MTCHIPTQRPGCWAAVMVDRPWRWADIQAQAATTGYPKPVIQFPVRECRAWADEAQLRSLQGNACDGCARLPFPLTNKEPTP